MIWQNISTAPKDIDILVWYDSDADSYYDPNEPSKLTAFGTWSEGGSFMDGKGVCVARWFDSQWEIEDEYGSGYWMPGYWFAKQVGDYEYVVNPTHWMMIEPPTEI